MGENLERTQVGQFPIGNLILKKKKNLASPRGCGGGTQQFPPPKWVQLTTEEPEQGKAKKVAQHGAAGPSTGAGRSLSF